MSLAQVIDRARRGEGPLVMGIVNVTPDSFSDGGHFLDPKKALEQARRLSAEGADILDVGGESTRPGSEPVTLEAELERVIPVIQAIVAELPTPVSVDTSKPEVMARAVKAGASMINDVNALRADGAMEAVAEAGVPVCLMHMQGEPGSMQKNPEYQDVVRDIKSFFLERILACEFAGIRRENLVLDPGFGFGKTLEHNLELLRRLGEFADLDRPLLVGLSRKSMLGRLTGQEDPEKRLAASLAAAVLAAERSAAIIRVHDVAPTVDAMAVTRAVARPDPGATIADDE